MTDQLTALAVQYAPLLRALKTGGHASSGDLAEKSGIIKNHIHRSLDAVEAGGLIVRDPAGPKHVAALTGTAETALEILSTQLIAAHRIKRWMGNPRTQFNEAEDHAMARSIGDKGVLQPLIVRPVAGSDDVEVIIGERRRRGSMIAIENAWQPADFLVPCKVRALTDEEAEEIAGVENLQREDMHWMDEARWYLRLATRPANPLSGQQIERLVDHRRKKRSIQDYIKCARELAPTDVDRTYLPDKLADGRPNPLHLNYVNARDLVGEKKEKPALDLSPKLAVTFVELVDAALGSPLTGPSQLPKKLVAALHKPPVGGPITTLVTDRKLGKWIFQDGRPALEIAVTDEVAAYLAQVGYMAAPCDAVYKLQAAVIGELQANVLAPKGRYFTNELNGPEPVAKPEERAADRTDDLEDDDEGDSHAVFDSEVVAEPENEAADDPDNLPPSQRRVLREIAARSIHRTRIADDWVNADPAALVDPDWLGLWDRHFVTHQTRGQGALVVALTVAGRDWLKQRGLLPEGKTANSCATPWLRNDYEADVEASAATPAPATTPAKPAEPLALPPMLAIVVAELAHRIAVEGIERGPGTWGVPVLSNYHRDDRGGKLVQSHRMIAFMPLGERTLCVLAKAGRDYLTEAFGLTFYENDKPVPVPIGQIQEQLLGGALPEGNIYSTPWLNPPAETPAAEAVSPPPPPPPRVAAFDPRRDTFSEQMIQLSRETRAMEAMAAALRHAEATLMSAGARPLKTEARDAAIALIRSALEAAQPYLPEPAHAG